MTSSRTESTRAAPQSTASLRPLWRNRDFTILFGGQAVSSLGTQVSQLAFPLLVLFVTHSPAQAGFIGAARAIPNLLFGLPAGALVDRWDRKRVMLVCDSLRALLLGSIPVALQGRVNSVFRLIAFGTQPLSLALTGFLLQVIGPVPTVLVTFVPQLLLAIAATLNPHVRHAPSIRKGE